MYSIGIDLGGTKIAAGIVDEKGVLIVKESVPTLAKRDYSLIMEDTATLVRSVCEKAGLPLKEMAGIGLGSPGTIDSGKGEIVYSCNINFERAPVREALQKHLGLPVFISNDANCAALGETGETGAAKGYRNIVMITLGTGVGGGIIIDGKIYEGDHSAGAELGHTMLVLDGVPCCCGRNGCWESYASANALIRETKEAIQSDRDTAMWDMTGRDYSNVSARTAFDAARKGDRVAMQVVETYVKYLSEGLIDMINIFRPEILLIGGGLCNEGDFLFDPVRAYVKKYAYGGDRTPVPLIKKAALGNDAGIIGAAMLVFRR